MFVMVLVAVYFVSQLDPPIAAVTRSTVEHYPSKETCEAEVAKQLKQFSSDMPSNPVAFLAKCVEVTGPAGQKA